MPFSRKQRSHRARRSKRRLGGDAEAFVSNGMQNLISEQPLTTPEMTGLNDQEIDQLHQEFEADAAGDIPGQAYGRPSQTSMSEDAFQPNVYPTSGVPPQNGGRRRRNKLSTRKKRGGRRKSQKKSPKRRNSKLSRRSRKRRSTRHHSRRHQRGGELAWSKMSSDVFSDRLTPSGIQETGRMQYNVGLPKSLINNPRIPDSVTQNRALSSIA